MQLNDQKARQLAIALTQATGLLLGSATAYAAEPVATPSMSAPNMPAAVAETNSTFDFQPSALLEKGWLVDSAVLIYQEADSRVQAIEPAIRVQKDLGDQHIVTAKLVLDSLTGASPNGATSANVPQSFTGASGGSAYGGGGGGEQENENENENEGAGQSGKVTPANQLPLDDEFKDTRVAATIGYSMPIATDTRLSLGANASSEYDFLSFGASGGLARDFNDKNTTVSADLNVEFDQIDPVGGAPIGLSNMFAAQKAGSDNKTLAELLFGVTQVINRHAIVQLNYGLSLSNGYQTDPYKVLTAVDANGNLLHDPQASLANQYLYLYEQRPDSRTRQSLFAGLKYGFDRGDVLDASYRLSSDDWGVVSHTLDAKYRYQIGEQFFVEPHLRYYQQSAADFYHSYLVQGRDFNLSADGSVDPLLSNASADSRLGAFDATTFGIKLGMDLANDRELSFRVEQYQQNPRDVVTIGGNLAGQVLQPDLSATFAQVAYRFKW